MREYILGVFAFSALLGICSMLLPEGESRTRRFAFTVLFLSVALLPLRDVSFSDISFPELVAPDTESPEYKEVAERAFVEGIETLVCREFSLEGECVRVMVEGFDFSKMRAEKIRIVLSGAAVLSDYKKIEKYINEQQMGECSVEIEIG